jgi:hypothetical protein
MPFSELLFLKRKRITLFSGGVFLVIIQHYKTIAPSPFPNKLCLTCKVGDNVIECIVVLHN